jgi:DNA-binding response OmpR family regulator
MKRILLIEDNVSLTRGLRNNLEIEGYAVEVARTGTKGLAQALATRPDLIVLDLMLPEMDGYRVLRGLRAEGLLCPVLVLTARGEEVDKVRGFRLGADDYVTKPFGLLELLARIEALLRRGAPAPVSDAPPRTERFGDMAIDHAARAVLRDGREVTLTPTEYELLNALVRRRGGVASRHELLREVWGYQADVVTRTVDTHVSELRRKLEDDAGSPRYILTVRKAGYRFRA